MRDKLIFIIKIVIEKLKSITRYLKRQESKPLMKYGFNSLSPIEDADQDNHYTDALNWALKTRHENGIRNIAITGPYGSGKSSVIKTFQKKYANNDFEFLNISLATFKEEVLNHHDNESDQDGNESNSCANDINDLLAKRSSVDDKNNPQDLIRLIELSILQQIFYHADDSDISESRFRKIKRINKWIIKAKSIATILFITSLVYLGRDYLPNIVLSIFNDINIQYFYCISLLYLLGLSYLLFFYIHTTQRKTFNIKLPGILIVINLILLLYVAYNEFIIWDSTLFELTGTELITKILESCALIYVFIFSIFSLYNLLQYVSRISINKFKFQDAEIELDTKISKSILNHHLDEILYFFEATKYSVVVIEDLDRFQQTEIFTKLREINLLLNNSKKTRHKNIVFIYAVRDDMFADKERSKFFDFIIPIIPVINSTNSSQQLLKKNAKYKYGWTEDLIDSLSIYIDDMRLLHNICNEFEIYKNKLTEKLDRNKLLAILVYKNLFPNDFSKLNNNEGNLWNRINSKQDFINVQILKIEEEIKLINVEMKELEYLKVIDIKELRLIYLSQYLQKIENFNCFNINGVDKSIDEMCEELNFDYLIENKATYSCFILYDHYNNRYNLRSNQAIGYQFEEIEVEVNENKTYKDRLEEINNWHLGKVNVLRKKIQELEKNKLKTRRSKIKDVLSNIINPVSNSKNVKQSKLINLLLRNGYIDEEYHDFMTIFYEGSLTKSDNDFLISVKSQVSSEFTFSLSNIDTLIKKIHPFDFEQAYVFNNDLMTFLLNNPIKYKDQFENVFKKLKDESDVSIEFIINYIDNGSEIEKFINKISKSWSGFWLQIENSLKITNDKKEEYFKHILLYADLPDIKALSQNSEMTLLIEKNNSFLKIIPDAKRLENIIHELDVSLEDIDFNSSNDELLTYVYENWNYKINPSNIIGFIKKYGYFNPQLFDTSNYQAILTSKCSELIDYINNNLDEYVENVYLKIKSNVSESEDNLIELLNKTELSFKLKNRIINKTSTVIQTLERIQDHTLYSILLSENKILAKWSNVLFAYKNLKTQITDSENEYNLPNEIVTFININENSKILSKSKTPIEGEHTSIYEKLWRAIIYSPDIHEENYSIIIKSCPWWYKNLRFENISEAKVKILINNKRIQPVEESYETIKLEHEGLNIYLFEKFKNDFLKLLDKIEFNSFDVELILKSSLLSSLEKFQVLSVCDKEVIQERNNLELVSSIMVSDDSLSIKEDILDTILLKSDIDTHQRLKIFIKNRNRYNNDFVENFIDTLDSKFLKINDKGSKAKIPTTQLNKQFLDVLEDIGYISSYSQSKFSNDYQVNHKRK